jgi:N-acetylglucosaminyldiphosphoundecaprenol N-acetyl-beta-D-mannosaminyltransferase
MLNIITRNSKKTEYKLNTFLNPYSYLLAQKDKKLFEKFNIRIDGIFLVKLLHLIGLKHIKRESFDMTTFAPIVFNQLIQEKKSVYIIGTKSELIKQAVINIKKEFKGLNIIGYRDGYIQPSEWEKVLLEIKEQNPDTVICGMGTPLQERFLLDLVNCGWNGVGYTCGGFLHQTSKQLAYYPDWINRYNIRWIYRIYKEPKLFKRYFWEYPKFFLGYFIIDWWIYQEKQIKLSGETLKKTGKSNEIAHHNTN